MDRVNSDFHLIESLSFAVASGSLVCWSLKFKTDQARRLLKMSTQHLRTQLKLTLLQTQSSLKCETYYDDIVLFILRGLASSSRWL